MKPHRIRMVHNLVLNYGLYRKMEIYVCSFLFFAFLVLISIFVIFRLLAPPQG